MIEEEEKLIFNLDDDKIDKIDKVDIVSVDKKEIIPLEKKQKRIIVEIEK